MATSERPKSVAVNPNSTYRVEASSTLTATSKDGSSTTVVRSRNTKFDLRQSSLDKINASAKVETVIPASEVEIVSKKNPSNAFFNTRTVQISGQDASTFAKVGPNPMSIRDDLVYDVSVPNRPVPKPQSVDVNAPTRPKEAENFGEALNVAATSEAWKGLAKARSRNPFGFSLNFGKAAIAKGTELYVAPVTSYLGGGKTSGEYTNKFYGLTIPISVPEEQAFSAETISGTYAGLGSDVKSSTKTVRTSAKVKIAAPKDVVTKGSAEAVASDVKSNFKDLVTVGEKRIQKSGAKTTGRKEVSVELSLRPIEGVQQYERIIGGGSTESFSGYTIVKKGKPVLINPKDIPNYDVVKVTGNVNIKTNQRGSSVPESSPLITDFNKLGNNFNKPSVNVGSDVGVSYDVKYLTSKKSFSQLVNLKEPMIISSDTFVSRLDTLDLPSAKIIRQKGVQKVVGGGFPRTTIKTTNLNVEGFNMKIGEERGPFSFFKRIGRERGSRYNPNQIEDMRFRLSFDEKKLLTAKNIREVTEFEGGYKVRLYTFDDTARIFKDVEVYIPKKSNTAFSSKVPIAPTTFSDISKKYSPGVDSGSVSSGGSVQTILKTENVKVESPKSQFSLQVSKEKVKSKQRSSSSPPKQEFSSKSDVVPPDTRLFEGTRSGVFSESSFDSIRRVSSRRRGVSGFIYAKSFDSSSASSFGTASSSVSDVGFKSVSDVGSSSGSVVSPFVGSRFGSSVSSRFSPKFDQKVDTTFDSTKFNPKDLVPDVNVPSRKKPKKFGFDFEGSSFGNVFGVEVRRGGKFKPVGSGLSLQKATSLGRNVVQNTAAATFRVVRGGVPVNIGNLSGFYAKQGGLNVEPRSLRIKSGGELREITFEGLRSQRR